MEWGLERGSSQGSGADWAARREAVAVGAVQRGRRVRGVAGAVQKDRREAAAGRRPCSIVDTEDLRWVGKCGKINRIKLSIKNETNLVKN